MRSHSRPVKPPRTAEPTKQARSRETLDRLLDAAEAVLTEGGLDHATVPRIAERAGMSVGVVYRRFADKDALLRAVYDRYFARIQGASSGRDVASLVAHLTLAELVHTVVGSTVALHLHRRQLLRALRTYAESTKDPSFRRRLDRLNAESLEQLKTLVLAHRYMITHPDPERAVAFAAFMLGAALRSFVQSDPTTLRTFELRGEDLAAELSRMFLSYLGAPLGHHADGR